MDLARGGGAIAYAPDTLVGQERDVVKSGQKSS
jgi:hypothetical protein